MIGDTEFFINLMHQGREAHAQAVTKARELEAHGVQISLTAITRFELFSGVAQFVSPEEEKNRVQSLLTTYPTYGLDESAADLSGMIYGSLRARGTPIGIPDALIAGITLRNREELLTRNRKDFSRVEGLVIVEY